MTAIGGSAASVVAAIRDEVESELENRQRELDEVVAAAEGETSDGEPSAADRAARLTQAREQARERLAQEDWLDSREALESRERWVLRAAAEGRRLLQERESAAEGPEFLLRLAAEGLAQLPGDSFEVVLSEQAAAGLTDEWCRRLEEQCRKRGVRLAAPNAGRPQGGCLVRTADGRMSFDNSFDARARRFETVWRSALAGLYG